jgi:hypothetical protein
MYRGKLVDNYTTESSTRLASNPDHSLGRNEHQTEVSHSSILNRAHLQAREMDSCFEKGQFTYHGTYWSRLILTDVHAARDSIEFGLVLPKAECALVMDELLDKIELYILRTRYSVHSRLTGELTALWRERTRLSAIDQTLSMAG